MRKLTKTPIPFVTLGVVSRRSRWTATVTCSRCGEKGMFICQSKDKRLAAKEIPAKFVCPECRVEVANTVHAEEGVSQAFIKQCKFDGWRRIYGKRR